MRFAIFDVDDVLIATADALEAAAGAMAAPLVEHLGRRRAVAVRREFTRAMGVGLRRLRAAEHTSDDEYADLVRRSSRWQRGVVEAGYEVKMWSRHSLLACALEVCEAPVTAAVVNAAVDRYWAAIAAQAHVYPDAAALIGRLRDAGVVVHLATGSDGFLRFDDARQTFTYDPLESVRSKLARLRGLETLGFTEADVSVGDPIGKPNPEFCDLALRRFATAAGEAIDLASTVVVGDSLVNDLLPFLRAGVAHGLWLVRDGVTDGSSAPDEVGVTESLEWEVVRHAFRI